MDSKYIVLLSGGLDSVVSLYLASKSGSVVRALTFDYGQRAAANEVTASRFFCEALNIKHEVIELPWLGKMTNTALVQKKQSMPSLMDLDDMTEATASAKSVWVPNRNGVFLNVAATFAESLGAQFVVPGFNKEEAVTFPDNSQEFIATCDAAFRLSTMNHVVVKCFTTEMNKTDLIRKAYELKIDLSRVWSCYQAGSIPCGSCESCQRTKRAVEIVGKTREL